MNLEKRVLRGLLLCILITAPLSLMAQKNEMKYGKIDEKNLELTTYAGDTSVIAEVIGEYGELRFDFNQTEGAWKMVFSRHSRVKIYKKEAFDEGDMTLIMDASDKFRVNACTYNLEKGKMKKYKLKNKDVQFAYDANNEYKRVKYALPNVKEGSIIEFEYQLTSDNYYSFPTWYFQRNIPVRSSEYNVVIPEYFEYRPVATGYIQLKESDMNTGRGSVMLNQRVRETTNRLAQSSSVQSESIDYMTKEYHYLGEDIPPFISEPMLTSSQNYILKIDFELTAIQNPGGERYNYSDNWASIHKKLKENQYFGTQINGGRFLHDDIERIKAEQNHPVGQMNACMELIKKKVKWNGIETKFTTTNIRNAYNNGEGNVADVNLMLIAMLKDAGFDAQPMLISTRNNGLVNTNFPTMSGFNYVIAAVNHEGNLYLMDATDPLSSINLLPERCLNGTGCLFGDVSTKLIDLNSVNRYKEKSVMKLSLHDDGSLQGERTSHKEGYAAYNLRYNIATETNEEGYINALMSQNPGLKVEEYSFDQLYDFLLPVDEKYTIQMQDQVDVMGDMMYVNPLFYDRTESNLFTVQDRAYPVDFSYPRKETYELELKYPEGYSVEELPENVSLNLFDGALQYTYTIEEKEGSIHLVNELQVNKVVFLHEEYAELKALFDQLVDQQAQMIVLKKQTTIQ